MSKENVPVQVVVAAFQTEDAAKAAYKELKLAKKAKLISIDNAAILRKDEKGKLHIKETHDMGGGKGAGIGALVGGAIGLLTGGVGLVGAGAVGALVGGITAKLHDGGFKDERLKKIGDGLEPGTSALIAVVEHDWVDELQKELEDEATDIMVANLSADIAQQLQAGGELAFTAVTSEGGMAMERVASSEEGVDMTDVVATEDGVIAEHIVATSEGVAGERLTASDDALTYEAGVVTESDAAYVAAAVTEEGVAVIAADISAEAEEAANSKETKESNDD